MGNEDVQPVRPAQEKGVPTALPAPAKRLWQEPRLVFVEPELTKHGKLEEVTGGFFGSFDQIP